MSNPPKKDGPPILKTCPACKTHLYSKYQVKRHYCGPLRSAH